MSQSVFPTSIPVRRDRAANLTIGWRPRRAGWRRLAALLRLWRERSHQRQNLAELAEWSDHLLRDIGISREEARREAAKLFWQK